MNYVQRDCVVMSATGTLGFGELNILGLPGVEAWESWAALTARLLGLLIRIQKSGEFPKIGDHNVVP